MAKKEPRLTFSKGELAKLKEKYKYVVAWYRATGSFEYFVEAKVIQANTDQAPENAYVFTLVGADDKGVPLENGKQIWHTYDPATAPKHIQDIINYGLTKGPEKR